MRFRRQRSVEAVHAAEGRRLAYAVEKRAKASGQGDWTQPPHGTERLDYDAPLTAREIQILGMVAHGQTGREIALELTLSEETIKSYMSHVLRKMGAASRAHAVHLAHQQGLLTTRSQEK